MARTVTLVESSELMQIAEDLGLGWNNACDFLYRDSVLPEAETNSLEYHVNDLNQYDWGDETKQVMAEAFKQFGSSFTLINS